MKFEYVYDFVINEESGEENEVRFVAHFEALSEAGAAADAEVFWLRLLDVLPAGRVGGGYYPAEEADDGPR